MVCLCCEIEKPQMLDKPEGETATMPQKLENPEEVTTTKPQKLPKNLETPEETMVMKPYVLKMPEENTTTTPPRGRTEACGPGAETRGEPYHYYHYADVTTRHCGAEPRFSLRRESGAETHSVHRGEGDGPRQYLGARRRGHPGDLRVHRGLRRRRCDREVRAHDEWLEVPRCV